MLEIAWDNKSMNVHWVFASMIFPVSAILAARHTNDGVGILAIHSLLGQCTIRRID